MGTRLAAAALLLGCLLAFASASSRQPLQSDAAAAIPAAATVQADEPLTPPSPRRKGGPSKADPAQQGLSPSGVYRCSTKIPTLEQRRRIEQDMAKAAPQSSVAPASEGSSIVIGTIFHIFTNSTGGGDLSDDIVAAQLAEMNDAYGPYFSFELLNITRTADDALNPLQPFSTEEAEAREMLRVGTMQHLNVYTTQLKPTFWGPVIGYTDMAFPWAPYPASSLYADGVMISSSTLPGVEDGPYNLGRTLVHEAGHWLGLYHTFQNGCMGFGPPWAYTGLWGDGVADTPAQKEAAYGCPQPGSINTCKSAGADPTDSFMDYTDDACMTRFTPGQFSRMVRFWQTYRANK